MMTEQSARDRIAERVKNAYAAGHNDGRKGLDRMDEVAETETGKILEVVREALLSEDSIRWAASGSADAMADMVEVHERYVPLGDTLDEPILLASSKAGLEKAMAATFGADDDGGERERG